MKKFSKILLTAALAVSSTFVSAADEVANLDELLQKLQQGKIAQTENNKQREAEFLAKRDQQNQILTDTIARRDAEVAKSARLETSFEEK